MKEKHLYRFGEFTLNAEDHILTRGGENVPVTPKMFDLLLVFVQNPGRVLGKEFLLNSVWPDSFVEEGNITFNVRQLRKALDDSAQTPTFIETIPRRGYRFLAPVEALSNFEEDDDVSDSVGIAENVAAPGGASRRRYIIPAVATLVLLVSAVALGVWLLSNGGSGVVPILAAPFKSEKLSTDGDVFHIALSPDGKNVVYTHRAAGKQSLWLRQLDTSTNVPIIPPSDDFYGGLVISPDGASVYFARGGGKEPQLNIYRMPIFGGVPQKVIESAQGWISLSTKGDKISYVRCSYIDQDWCSLYIADASNGGNEKKLVTRPRPMRIGDNKISPDGRTIAYAVGQSRTASNDFQAYAVDIETSVERTLTADRFFNISYLAWLPDQSGLLMTAMQLPEAHYRIWHVSNSGESKKVTTDSESYSRLSLDATGTVLVSTHVEPDFRLMLFQTDEPTQPPPVLGNANTVAFAPDGTVYFSTMRTGNAEIWRANPDGGDQRQLTNDVGSDVAPMISSDSDTVFFESNRSGAIHVWRMDPDGTNQQQLTKEDGGLPLRLSPDRQWLYYRSALTGAIRRVAVETGQEEEVIRDIGGLATLSPDLTTVAFWERRNQDLFLEVMSVADRSIVKSFRITHAPNMAHLAWSGDGKFLAYILTADKREISELWFQHLDTDYPRRIADLAGQEIAEFQGFALSPDAKRFAVIKGNWKHDAVLLRGLKN